MLKFCAVIFLFAILRFVSCLGNSIRNYDNDVISNFVHSPSSNARITADHLSSSGLVKKVPKRAKLAQPQNGFIVNNSTVGVCICVTTGSCNAANPTPPPPPDGSNIIDPRIINNQPVPTSAPTSTITPISSGLTPNVVAQNFCPTGLERCCPPNGYSCGIRYPPISSAQPPTAGQAAYGAYPWQVVILTTADAFIASGALIDHLHIITAAHKVSTIVSQGQQLKIRVGEYNALAATEPIPVQEFFVSRVFIHPQFTSANLKNDIAILRTSAAIPLGVSPVVSTVCLPSIMLTAGTRCFIAGWGKNDFSATGQFQAILKEVDVPIVEQVSCQNLLRATRLGANFILDTTSFMCAGGEAGKDACTGDGGAPLVCQNSGRWYVMGLVAWGIGCGTGSVPGVYVNIPNYLSWIQQTTRSP